MLEILITCLLVMIASLGGAVVFLTSKTRIFIERHISLLTSFAVGVFGVVVFLLLDEAGARGNFSSVAIWALIGAFVSIALSKLIPEFHHHHTQDTEHSHSKNSAIRILVSDGLHNIADGILITTSFLAGGAVGVGTALSVLVHELVQEVTEFFVLRQAGYNTKQALARNFLVSTTVLIGAIGSFYFLEFFEEFEPVLLGLAAGGLLSVLCQDLIPVSIKAAQKSKKIPVYLVFALLGVLVMVAVGSFGEHGHGDDEHYDDIHDEYNKELIHQD